MSNWQVDKKIDLTQIFTLIAFIFSLMAWGLTIEKRMEVGRVKLEGMRRELQELKAGLQVLETRINEYHIGPGGD